MIRDLKHTDGVRDNDRIMRSFYIPSAKEFKKKIHCSRFVVKPYRFL